jgi:hypothetical protein
MNIVQKTTLEKFREGIYRCYTGIVVARWAPRYWRTRSFNRGRDDSRPNLRGGLPRRFVGFGQGATRITRWTSVQHRQPVLVSSGLQCDQLGNILLTLQILSDGRHASSAVEGEQALKMVKDQCTKLDLVSLDVKLRRHRAYLPGAMC